MGAEGFGLLADASSVQLLVLIRGTEEPWRSVVECGGVWWSDEDEV